MERLADRTESLRQRAARLTVGRYLQAHAQGKGDPGASAAWLDGDPQRRWTDREVLKAAVTQIGAADYPEFGPVGEAFLAAVRPHSVPLQLEAWLRRVPMYTRLFINTVGTTGAQVTEGKGLPVLRSTWDATTLTPHRHGGIVVQTDELMASAQPSAALAISDDLAAAVGEAESRSFLSPDATGSVLDGAPSFAGTGGTVAAVDADLRALIDLVPGAFRPGSAFVMTMPTATYLGTLRDGDGAAAYPDIGPQGGVLLGLPVIISAACQEIGSPPTRIVALLSPQEIFYADEGRVALTTSQHAAIQMDDAPTQDGGAGTGAALVSMFQAHCTATKAVRESSWYARAGAGAYFVAGF